MQGRGHISDFNKIKQLRNKQKNPVRNSDTTARHHRGLHTDYRAVGSNKHAKHVVAFPTPTACYVQPSLSLRTLVDIASLLTFSGTTVAVLVAGAAVAGFVTGLAGFGTALVALAFWLHVVDARLAGPLVAVCAVASQVSGARIIWRGMHWPRLWPVLLGGVAGLPLGIALVNWVDTDALKGAVGLILVGYSVYNLLRGHLRVPRWGGRGADGAMGAAGGVLGGAAGLAGVLPAVWCTMRGWPPGEQRGVYQPFTLAVLALAIPGHAISGALDARVLAASIITIPAAWLAGWLGLACYGHLDARQFRVLVLWLLLASGIALLPDLLRS